MRAIRGSILHCLRDPDFPPQPDAVEHFEDGLLLVDNGKIVACGHADKLLTGLSTDIQVTDYRGRLILPGFIDCHVHYPQLSVIGSYGTQLLEWLESYTFPAEAKFADRVHATNTAKTFVNELLRNGTTTAMVFATVHPESVDAIFEAACDQRMRLYSGKVLMDRHCPDDLRDSPEQGYAESRELIEKWHGVDRLGYAITPRFAPTSSPEQLRRAGDLANEFPDVHIHTHLSENHSEIAWVAELFPKARSYLDVYQSFDLVRERSVFAHCVHLDDQDLGQMCQHQAAAAFCPSSNLFLGSGLFDFVRTRNAGVNVGLGTDVGGGTSLSLFNTMADGYKVMQLNGKSLSAFRALYLATLGGAEALCADDRIGNFAVGKEADFIVVDPHSTPMISQRQAITRSIAESFFVQMTLADDRAIEATWILGEPAFERAQAVSDQTDQ
ncbi:MAG: guanine deaminase [Woeseiaceae bacterium]